MARSRRCCCCMRLYWWASPNIVEWVDIKTRKFRNRETDMSLNAIGLDHKTQDFYNKYIPGAAATKNIFKFDKDLTEHIAVGAANNNLFDGAVDYTGKRLFCDDSGTLDEVGKISIRTYAGADSTILTTTKPVGDEVSFIRLAYFRSIDKVYFVRNWLDNSAFPSPGTNERTIRRIDADGSNETVIYTASNSPVVTVGQLAPDNTNRKLWWAEYSGNVTGLIKRCNPDGTNVETMRTESGFFVRCVAWSHHLKRIFWFIEKLSTTSSADTVGGLYSAKYDMSDMKQEFARNSVALDSTIGIFAGSVNMIKIYLGCGLEAVGSTTEA